MIIITYVANLKEYKNHKLLIDACALLGQFYELWLIGRDDGMGPELTHRALQKKVNAKFWGYQSDVEKFLLQTDIYAHSSSEEGCSNAIIESMKAGLPSVVTDVGGNPELVIHGKTGFVSPLTAHHFSSLLIALVHDPLIRKWLGKRARQRYERRFTIDKMVKNYKEFYAAIS